MNIRTHYWLQLAGVIFGTFALVAGGAIAGKAQGSLNPFYHYMQARILQWIDESGEPYAVGGNNAPDVAPYHSGSGE